MNLLKIEAKTGRVKLNDSVNPWSTDDLLSDMEKLYGTEAAAKGMVFGEITAKADDAVDVLEIEINSPGGSVFDGVRIYHAIKEIQSRGVRVVSIINSIAASMASVIAVAANEVRMVAGGKMMIHEPSMGTHGTAGEHARNAALLDTIAVEMADIYAERTGGTAEEMRQLMLAETWMGTKDALARNFIDAIHKPSGAKADADFDFEPKTTNIKTMSILERLRTPATAEAVAKIDGLTARVSELETDLTAAATEVQSLAAQVTAKDETIAEMTGVISTMEAAATAAAKLVSDHAATITALQAEIESGKKDAARLTTEMLASAGQPEPVTTGSDSASDEPKTITRAQMNAMKPFEVAAFFKSGGKLTN